MNLFKTFADKHDLFLSKGYDVAQIYHAKRKAELNIILNPDGSFASINKRTDESQVSIPATENSSIRTGGIHANPLNDNLLYLSKSCDTESFNKCITFLTENVDKKKAAQVERKAKRCQKCNETYLPLLKSWVDFESGETQKFLTAIYQYVSGGTIAEDVSSFILNTSSEKELTKDIMKIFDSTIVFSVLENKSAFNSWESKVLFDSWIKFYEKQNPDNLKRGLCEIYFEDNALLCNMFPKYFFKLSSGAKLISASNAGAFCGNFGNKKTNYFEMSKKISDKAHSALKFVIDNFSVSLAGKKKNDTFILFSDKRDLEEIKDACDSLFENKTLPNQEAEEKTVSDSIRSIFMGKKISLDVEDNLYIAKIVALSKGRASLSIPETLVYSKFYNGIQTWRNHMPMGIWSLIGKVFFNEGKNIKRNNKDDQSRIKDSIFNSVIRGNVIPSKTINFICDMIVSRLKVGENVHEALKVLFHIDQYNLKTQGEKKMNQSDLSTVETYCAKLMAVAEYVEVSYLRIKEAKRATYATSKLHEVGASPERTIRTVNTRLYRYIIPTLQKNRGKDYLAMDLFDKVTQEIAELNINGILENLPKQVCLKNFFVKFYSEKMNNKTWIKNKFEELKKKKEEREAATEEKETTT